MQMRDKLQRPSIDRTLIEGEEGRKTWRVAGGAIVIFEPGANAPPAPPYLWYWGSDRDSGAAVESKGGREKKGGKEWVNGGHESGGCCTRGLGRGHVQERGREGRGHKIECEREKKGGKGTV